MHVLSNKENYYDPQYYPDITKTHATGGMENCHHIITLLIMGGHVYWLLYCMSVSQLSFYTQHFQIQFLISSRINVCQMGLPRICSLYFIEGTNRGPKDTPNSNLKP